MAFTVTTSYQISMWTQANPAFNDRAHFRFKPLQTSHLTSNLICQHPIFCLILLSCSWVYIATVWTWYMLDTALPIISMLCGTEAGQPHWDWMNGTVNCWSLPSCYLVADIENNLPVNPLTFTANAHTCSPKNTKLETQIYWRCDGEGVLIFMVTEVNYRAYEDGKLVSDVAWKGT